LALVYQHNINETTRLAVWHITEPESFFLKKVPLKKDVSHPHKRLQHLAGRYLLSFLFDGFPRTVPQAEVLDKFMKDNGTAIHFIIALDVTEAELRARIAKRRSTENRVDDEEEKLNKRVTEYFTKTIHVLPYYEKQKRLNTVHGIGDIEEIFGNICKVIDKK